MVRTFRDPNAFRPPVSPPFPSRRCPPAAQARTGPSPAPQSRYSPLLGDGARLLRGGSGSGRRRGGRRRRSPRFALIGTQSLLGPAQQMARKNPQPPPGAVPLPVRCRTGAGARARARPARRSRSRRLRHGFRLVPPPGTAGRG